MEVLKTIRNGEQAPMVFSAAEMQARLTKLRELMANENITACLFYFIITTLTITADFCIASSVGLMDWW